MAMSERSRRRLARLRKWADDNPRIVLAALAITGLWIGYLFEWLRHR